MPELPEVETVRRGLEPALVGARLVSVEARRPDLRFPLPEHFAVRLTGRRVESLSRRAKYLLADFDDGTVLISHLGMSGSFRIVPAAEAGKAPGAFHHPRSKAELHDHVVFRTDRGDSIIYNDPRRFGFMLLTTRAELPDHPSIRNLGIEPLGNELDGPMLARAFAGRSTSMKAALLDQSAIAGLGNIYVCEALHRAGISPKREANVLAARGGAPKASLLASSIRDVLEEAVIAGGSSISDHVQTSGELGYFQHSFRVYEREGEPCLRAGCTGTVKRIVQSGRSTFYCPVCQR